MSSAASPSNRFHGPLVGIKVVEFAAIGPGPFAGMLLSDLGADVIRIDRPGAAGGGPKDIVGRGRRSIALDLKNKADIATALRLIERADALIEGFRPGVMERLGLGPEVALAHNPGLVYGRMTGWGQDGPLASAAGHDINYIALTGALAAIGPSERPMPPLNLIGDFGGGGLYLVLGVLAALLERRRSGKGQVVDCAMVDGATSLMTMFYALRAMGRWNLERASNFLDGGAHFYGSYECADGRFIALGAIEPQFYAELRRRVGLDDPLFDRQHDSAAWPELRDKLTAIFRTQTRDEWCRILEGSDVCFAPVLDLDEASDHPHIRYRETVVTVDEVRQPAPAPRFSRTPGAIQGQGPRAGEHAAEILADWGVDPAS